MIVVVGAGVVGLATAAALGRRGVQVTVLERHGVAGHETSVRGSGVVHAGLYYPPGSLKARLCVDGHDRLLAYADARNLPLARLGKLVVAQEGELPDLERLLDRATSAGAKAEIVDRAFVHAREPHVSAAAALWSPMTASIDAAAYVRSLARDVVDNGGLIRFSNAVVDVQTKSNGFEVVTTHERISCHTLVNAAGLYADDVSRLCGGERFTIYPCRGEYAELVPAARHFIRGLVYPVPHASGHGLGVHFTPKPDGRVLVGPTVRYQHDKNDYDGDRLGLDDFLEMGRALLPDLSHADLRLAGSGIRPKLHPPEEAFADFLIRRDLQNPHLIQVAGIESPGLTASLAIGEMVADMTNG